MVAQVVLRRIMQGSLFPNMTFLNMHIIELQSPAYFTVNMLPSNQIFNGQTIAGVNFIIRKAMHQKQYKINALFLVMGASDYL